jgi:hypothetical protein
MISIISRRAFAFRFAGILPAPLTVSARTRRPTNPGDPCETSFESAAIFPAASRARDIRAAADTASPRAPASPQVSRRILDRSSRSNLLIDENPAVSPVLAHRMNLSAKSFCRPSFRFCGFFFSISRR